MNERPSRVVRISVYMPAQSTLVDWACNTQCIHSVLPAQLKEGTEVYAINEISTSYLVHTPGNTVWIPVRALVLTRNRSVFHT